MTATQVIDNLKRLRKLSDSTEVNGEDEEIVLSYFMDHLTPAMQEEAREHLNETDETKAKALEELRELIMKEKHLLSYMHDGFLLAFLRARKFNVKRAFKLLQNFWTFRKEHRSIYDMSHPESVHKIILKAKFGFLTCRDRGGCVVSIFKVGLWDPEEETFEQIFRSVTAILLDAIKYPATQVCGFRCILDLRELNWKQVKLCTPKNLMLLIRSTQFCFPGRYKGVHILTENKLFNTVWAVAHPLLTSKLRRRITLHHSNDYAPLLEHIHPSILPEEYGGRAAHFSNDFWKEILVQNTEYVMDMLNYGYKN